MQLSDLLKRPLDKDFELSRVVDDTRHLQAGDVFVFDTRIHPQGLEFVRKAAERGAAAVVSNVEAPGVLFDAHPGVVLARWAKHLNPLQPLHAAAVTGTNGKTSVAYFYQQLAAFAGYNAASVGTLGVVQRQKVLRETGYTSPTALHTHEILNGLAEEGVEYVCMEASSHALALSRFDEVRFQAAALTNITQDHLDFHQTMDAYAAAKGRLFSTLLPEDGTAVLNMQKQESWPFAALCKERGVSVFTVGTANAELVVDPIEMSADGLRADIKVTGARREVLLPLLGAFQSENLATALGLAYASGIGLEDLLAVVGQVTSVPGRMELIPRQQDHQPAVVVDYAHTPDALRIALQALRPVVPEDGRLWVVFGAGGDRDTTKRPLMGQACAELADVAVITDDNPRTEDAGHIRDMVAQGAPDAHNIGDRRDAIAYALTHAGEKDVVLLAGKGHESGQIIGHEKIPFDDRNVAREIMAATSS